MAVAFRSIANKAYGASTSSTTLVITAPAGIQNDDILLCGTFTTRGTGATHGVVFPSGFAEIAATPTYPFISDFSGLFYEYRMAWKRAASEAGDYTVTLAAGAGNNAAFVAAYSGAVTGVSPLGVTPTSNAGTGTTTTATGLTTTVNDSMLVYFAHDFADTSNNLSPPAGATPTFTERLDAVVIYMADGALATAGATGDKTQTNNNSGARPWSVYFVCLDAPAGGTQNAIWLVTA